MQVVDGPRLELRLGHLVGVAGAVIWLTPLIATLVGGSADTSEGARLEGLGVVTLALANIVGVGVSLRQPVVGYRWLGITGALFSTFGLVTADRNHWLAVLASGGPFLLSALLIWLAVREADH